MAEPTKDLTPKTRPPRIGWKAVRPKHYEAAQAVWKTDGQGAYTDYVLALVETWDFANVAGMPVPVTQPDVLSRAQVEQVLAAFESEFGPGVGGQGSEEKGGGE